MKAIILFIFISFNSYAEVAPFAVNADSIREQVLSKNISLLESLNHVEASKLDVNMARAKLFPSLNLGVLLPGLANPTFLLGSVNFLFPFLVPSNWAVLKQEKNLLEADKASYKALELNLLSNAYSLYHTHLSDRSVQSIYNDQADILERLHASLKRQSEVLGNVTVEDLDMAAAQMNEAKIKASKLQELIIAENASLRTLLSLPLGTELKMEESELLPSGFEGKNIYEIFDRSMLVAPEVTQLNFLVKAAQAGKFSKLMGFISQSSMSGQATSSNSVFLNLKIGGSFSFGLDNVVSLEIADNNIDSLKLRQDQLKIENEKTAEIWVNQLSEMKSQMNLSAEALKNRQSVYDGQKRQYLLGLISLQTLLQTQSQLTDAKVSFKKSELDLKLQRLGLLRLVIDGDFSKIKGCTGVVDESTSNKAFFGIGHKKPKSQSLDEVCRQ